MKATKHVRGVPEKDRTADHSHKPSAYPFSGGLNVEEHTEVLAYLAKFNAGLADVESGLLFHGLAPGMAGHDDEAEGETGYSVPSPGLDPAVYGLPRPKVSTV